MQRQTGLQDWMGSLVLLIPVDIVDEKYVQLPQEQVSKGTSTSDIIIKKCTWACVWHQVLMGL